MEPEIEIDAVGLICPLPVLRLRKRLLALDAGSVLRIETDDPVAVIDIPHFCTEHGHVILDQSDAGPVTRWTIRRGPTPEADAED